MEKVAIAESLVVELEAELAKLEQLGALIAAAHLDAAINALCREFNIERNRSEPD
ncbi:hypothetical protein SAMN05518801_106205 [Novosphingobium sp. CF614]|uniref:hypothetical protein n=1 Tax=Novosphingobium sp. CF614 TaxID=1884364 RepID=UPI0008F34CB8|nr:hypothetical protein [Novosphingobium sp. CF614]SFG06118.1 hypothetical protein SAMN05518801_106205 [Novosphingobium sp. CF614]